MTTFSAETYQNEFLPAGATRVDAIVTVTSSGGASAAQLNQARAEVIIVDVSGSMKSPHQKLKAAIAATIAAVDCLPDGTLFGIIAGHNDAWRVYPSGNELATASMVTRSEAKHEVSRLHARGGTAMGRWLMEAYNWFAAYPGAIRHAILLTDGMNGESLAYLAAALESCQGAFQCDCRGVGTDWRVDELRSVANALLGSVDIVAAPEGLRADFESILRAAMGKQVADVNLRLWAPRGAAVASVQQVAPAVEDLAGRGQRVNELTVDYPTGAWADESRDYHVCIDVPAREVGEEMLAGRVSLVVDGEVVSESLVKAVWTDDVAMSTRINPHVAHYTGQVELAAALADGLEARRAGDDATATSRLGRAAQLAAESGNDGTLQLLARVVEVEDAASGTVRLRRNVDAADEMALDTRSTKTVRVRPDG